VTLRYCIKTAKRTVEILIIRGEPHHSSHITDRSPLTEASYTEAVCAIFGQQVNYLGSKRWRIAI